MIQMIRVDDRLLHGQVAYSWRAKLSYDAVVIVSEQAAKDDLRKSTLKMCCPDGVKLATRGIEDAAQLLNNDQLKTMKVFVICSDPNTMYKLVHEINEKPLLNLGGMQKQDNTVMFSKSVYLSQQYLDCLDRLQNEGYHIEVQQVPETSMRLYQDLRKG